MTFGGGVAYKLSNKINVGLEQKFVNAFNDDMDGLYEGNANDIVSLTRVRLNYNFGSPDKHVEPLWWINPNNYLYNELNNPRHMKQPKIVLPDGDNDGVTDQFDLEPNTPAGAAVDAHGRAKDTDGDGVPDYKDKEILTQLSCFPVDKDGVGKCPEPACCKEIKDMMANWKPTGGGTGGGMDGAGITECAIGDLPSVVFKKGAQLSREAQSVLAAAAAKIKANPSCKVKLIGYGTSSKNAQQLSWERVNAVKKYLVEQQGISETRIIFSYGQDGDANTVDIQATTEEGPMNLPAPHPNLKGRG
jgi:outer membrane protein OmpA-like peptidoglycan-associated protein